MASDLFELKPLEEMVSIHDADRVPVKKGDRKKGIYPYYGASGITDYIDDFIFDGDYVLLSEDGDNLRTRNTPIAFMARGKFWVNNHAHILKGKNGNNTDFICYALQVADVNSYISGSTRPKITQRDMKNIPVYCPPLPEQKAIAHILGSLDDKIELNRQMNETLEAMAQALFKSWFVDFDPVIDNAIKAGKPIPDELATRAELRKNIAKKDNPEIQRLFPDEFEFTEELGWIPKGWEITSLASLVKLIGGGTPKTSVEEYWNGDIPWFSVVDAPSQSDIFVLDTEKHVTDLGVEKSSTKILPVGTTIISARGTVGKCAMVSRPMAMNQSCYGIAGKEGIADTFVYYAVFLSVSELQNKAHGSVFNTITGNTFKSINLAFQDKNLTKRFDNLVKPYFDKVLENSLQSKSLTKLRDTLLPKLMTGEIRVSDAAAMVEDA